MNYQDMLNLKNGDLIIIKGVAGEVTGKGSLCGTPAVWLKHVDRHGKTVESLFPTGACWKEAAYYKFGEHRLIRWQNEAKEEHSLQNKQEQQALF